MWPSAETCGPVPNSAELLWTRGDASRGPGVRAKLHACFWLNYRGNTGHPQGKMNSEQVHVRRHSGEMAAQGQAPSGCFPEEFPSAARASAVHTRHQPCGGGGRRVRRGSSGQTGTYGCRLLCAVPRFAGMTRRPTRRRGACGVAVGADPSLRPPYSPPGSAPDAHSAVGALVCGPGRVGRGLEGAGGSRPRGPQPPGSQPGAGCPKAEQVKGRGQGSRLGLARLPCSPPTAPGGAQKRAAAGATFLCSCARPLASRLGGTWPGHVA